MRSLLLLAGLLAGAGCGDEVPPPVGCDAPVCLGRTRLLRTAAGWQSLSLLSASDLTGDGRSDLVVVEEGRTATATVSVLVDLAEVFTAPIPASAPIRVLLDADADGAADLVVVGRSTGTLRRGRGDGTFDPPLTFGTGEFTLGGAQIGDVDGDGLPDLVFGALKDLESRVRVYALLDRRTTFELISSGVYLPEGEWSPALLDVDGDGRLNLYETDDTGVARWARGRGDGTFDDLVILFQRDDLLFLSPYPLGLDARTGFLGTLRDGTLLPLEDEDAHLVPAGPAVAAGRSWVGLGPRLAVLDEALRVVAVPSGDALEARPAAPGAESLALWDLHHDGSALLVELAGADAYVHGMGAGGLEDPVKLSFNLLGEPADLDGDDRPDFVVARHHSLGVVLGREDEGVRSFGGGERATVRFELADLDGDGLPNLLGCTGADLELRRGLGEGGFGAPEPMGVAASSLAIADLDGDGSLDAATAGGGTLAIHRGRGDGTFELSVASATVTGAITALRAGDVSGDGAADLIVAAGGRIDVFSPAGALLRSTPGDRLLAVDDLDGDGRSEIVVARGEEAVAWSGGELPIHRPSCAAAGDFDGDGAVNLAIGTADDVRLYFGGRGGPLTEGPVLAVPFAPWKLAVADFDGDGLDNLAVFSGLSVDPNGHPVSPLERQDFTTVLLGRRDRSIVRAHSFYLRGRSLDGAVADVDGDARPDVVTSAEPAEITVVRSRP